MPSIRLRVNDKDRDLDVPQGMPLLWALRDVLGLTGTHYGCGVGSCGACTVHLDGRAVQSCSVTATSAVGKAVRTIEGLAGAGLHPVQQAWLDADVAQCGYCQAGQIMAAAALLAQTPAPDDAQIDAGMADNVCRCGSYVRIREAIRLAASRRAVAEVTA